MNKQHVFFTVIFSLFLFQNTIAKETSRTVSMPAFGMPLSTAENDNKIGGFVFAHKFETDITPDNSGVIEQIDNNMLVWKVNLTSSGAYSINFLISNIHLDASESILIKNKSGEIIKAYTALDNTPSHKIQTTPMEGDYLIIEYYFSGKKTPEIQISEVNHDYAGFFRALPGSPGSGDNCNWPISCLEPEQYLITERSTVLLFINGTTSMSGSLINNTSNNGKPYILTAAHGFKNSASTPAELAATVITYFNYQIPACKENIIPSYDFTITGADLLAIDEGLDFALLELDKNPPPDFRPYYAGWNLTTDPSENTFCIQQPLSGPKNVSYANVTPTAADASSQFKGAGITPNSHWKIQQWRVGSTHSGSSGSALFDENQLIIGGLSGGSSKCGLKGSDFFFRLNKAWDFYPEPERQLKRWLDSENTGSTQINGYDPYADLAYERISYITKDIDTSNGRLTDPNKGYMAGQNNVGCTAYAQQFTTTKSPAFLYGFYFINVLGKNSSNVTFHIYDQLAEEATPLASSTVNLSTIQYRKDGFYSSSKSTFANTENYIRFEEAIEIPETFYIAYSIPYSTPIDTFALYVADHAENIAFFRNDTWTSFEQAPFNQNIALYIDAVVANNSFDYPPTPVDNTQTCIYDSVSFSLFPNPASEYLCINMENYADVDVEIRDMQGKIINKLQFSETGLVEISVNNLNKGVYLISVIYNDKVETRKFIKQ